MPGEKKPSSAEEALLFLLRHPLRKRLLRLYVEAKEMRSPKELTIATKQYITNKRLSQVSYHVRVLAEHGAVRLVESKPRRGAVEHFYEVTSLVDDVPWGRIALLGLEGEIT